MISYSKPLQELLRSKLNCMPTAQKEPQSADDAIFGAAYKGGSRS